MDPRNASDAILDSDQDGWDSNRDGILAPDNSIATSMWGEALSNYEEFKISQDDGYSVRPGLYLSSIDRPLDVDFLTETSQPRIADSAIVGTHVSENQGIVVIASKNGVTILDPLSYTTQIFDQPVPGTISDSLLVSLADNSVALVLTSNFGIGAFQLTQGGLNLESSFFLQSDPILSVNPLSTSMGPGSPPCFRKRWESPHNEG